MRITLILCFFIQLVFPATVNNKEMIVPHTKSLTMTHFIDSDSSPWTLEKMLSLYSFDDIDDSLKIYPNPVNRRDMLNVSMDDTGKKRLTFYDITGKMVKVVETERKTFSFGISDLGSGVYILNIATVNFQTAKKVIVK
ncbi:T9SS type A sorting domain-containing protein [Galbibacter pacificus]|uniref:T9SS type A sorting domain-containing protein n=1 Tax=Galbibacter pacificus TaxID=2996052 RepID=A0ABT6FUI4_9FLAO|nr:T9SS type A sorting domain-containing protein [Galbibacter pacificus]MDG3583608.1 T9SS type A sorting domain-containing protein [Galbibacter pacificus]MDG3586916.1 T9SS type A sorting domain-containing protein [Galbibacter pacificus]